MKKKSKKVFNKGYRDKKLFSTKNYDLNRLLSIKEFFNFKQRCAKNLIFIFGVITDPIVCATACKQM